VIAIAIMAVKRANAELLLGDAARSTRTDGREVHSGEQGETTMAAHFSRSPDSFSNQPGPRVPRASKRGHFQLRSGYWQAQSGQLAEAPTMLGRRLWRAPFARARGLMRLRNTAPFGREQPAARCGCGVSLPNCSRAIR